MTIGVDVAQLFAQSLEPSGKRGLVVLRLFAITFFACVVGHAFDTRVGFGKITTISAPKVARTILDWVYTSQELRLRRNPLKTQNHTNTVDSAPNVEAELGLGLMLASMV